MNKTGVGTWWLGGAIAFSALAFAPLPEASAGCGDYLTMGHESVVHKDGSDGKKPEAAPCHGPQCRQREAPLLPPSQDFRIPAPPTKAVSELLHLVLTAPPKRDWAAVPEGDLLTGFRSSILRPPRAS